MSSSATHPAAPRQRVFAYCHDSVGIGHLNRTLAICDRVGEAFPKATFLIATGTPYISLFQHGPRADYIKLPSLSKVDNRTYRGRYLNIEVERLIRWRSSLLKDAVEYFDPDVVLVDKAPVGVRGELLATLRWLRRARPDTRVIFGMRDIEDAPEVTIGLWKEAGVFEVLEECYDEIWVYGNRDVFDVTTQYALPAAVCEKLRFLGYVVHAPKTEAPAVPEGTEGVLVTVGGGTDGEWLLSTYLAEAAPRAAEAGHRSTLIGGPDLPPEVAVALREQAAQIGSTEWVDFEPRITARMRAARVVVSMGGYNTLCELAWHKKPALVVPRTEPRVEQLMRARLWAERGALEVLEPASLSATTLADRVLDKLSNGCQPTAPDLDFGGLDRIHDRFGHFWREEPRRATPVCL